MTIFIENPATLELLTSEGRWTRDSRKAAVFANTTLARKSGALAAIGAFNVIGTFRNSPQITNLDVGCGTAHP